MEPLRPLHKRILRWGNSYGIRLTKDDLTQMGMYPDEEVDVKVERCAPAVDWTHLPAFSLAHDASIRHDEIIGESDAAEAEDRPAPRRRAGRAAAPEADR